MHTPTYNKKTTELVSPQTRLFLVGPPKSGKTYAAVTFPNPTVIDFDSGLTNKDIREHGINFLPFYSESFIHDIMKQQNKVNALSLFLKEEAPKFTFEQTLIFDSVSTIGDSLMEDIERRCPITKSGEKDGFWIWKMWSLWWQNFCSRLLDLKCNVVVIAHEQEVRDSETGKLLAYKWLLKGQDFSPRMAQFFTDVFRQVKKSEEANGKIKIEYLWQVHGDTLFPFACTRMNVDTKLVKANFSSFKY